MNKVILVGRITKDAEEQRGNSTFCRFNLAVDRRFRKEGDEQIADFIGCVAFGKTAEFLEKYGPKGTKFVLEGRLQTGRYTNDAGITVYTTDVVVEHLEFAESKKYGSSPIGVDADGFMQIPDDIDEEVPFK
jgi:single-strand DNA-binding protein